MTRRIPRQTYSRTNPTGKYTGFTLWAAAILALVVGGCAIFSGSDGNNTHPALDGTSWEMDNMVVSGTSYAGASGDFTMLFDDMNAGGRGDCNQWSSQYERTDDGSLTFTQIITTKIACPPGTIENIYYDALSRVSQFEVDDDEMVLTAENGDSLVFDRDVDESS